MGNLNWGTIHCFDLGQWVAADQPPVADWQHRGARYQVDNRPVTTITNEERLPYRQLPQPVSNYIRIPSTLRQLAPVTWGQADRSYLQTTSRWLQSKRLANGSSDGIRWLRPADIVPLLPKTDYRPQQTLLFLNVGQCSRFTQPIQSIELASFSRPFC